MQAQCMHPSFQVLPLVSYLRLMTRGYRARAKRQNDQTGRRSGRLSNPPTGAKERSGPQAGRLGGPQPAAGILARDAHLVPACVWASSFSINGDVACGTTTGGMVALKDLIAGEDAPVVAHLKRVGTVIVDHHNAPAFSLRWFTDKRPAWPHAKPIRRQRHAARQKRRCRPPPWPPAWGRLHTATTTAAASATRPGPVVCWACAQRAGCITTFNGSANDERIISNQLRSVQGLLRRDPSVAVK